MILQKLHGGCENPHFLSSKTRATTQVFVRKFHFPLLNERNPPGALEDFVFPVPVCKALENWSWHCRLQIRLFLRQKCKNSIYVAGATSNLEGCRAFIQDNKEFVAQSSTCLGRILPHFDSFWIGGQSTRIGEEGEAALGGKVHFGFLGRLVGRAVDPDAILNPMSN